MFVSPVPTQVNGTLFLAPLLELLRHPLLPFRVPTEGKVGLSSTVPEVICSGPYANEDTCILHIGSNFRSTAWRWGDAVAVGVAAVAAEFAPGLVCFHCRYLIGTTLLEKRVTPPGDRLHSPAAGGSSDLESVFLCVYNGNSHTTNGYQYFSQWYVPNLLSPVGNVIGRALQCLISVVGQTVPGCQHPSIRRNIRHLNQRWTVTASIRRSGTPPSRALRRAAPSPPPVLSESYS